MDGCAITTLSIMPLRNDYCFNFETFDINNDLFNSTGWLSKDAFGLSMIK